MILPIKLVFSAAPFVYLSPTYILTIKLSLLLGIVLEKYQKIDNFRAFKVRNDDRYIGVIVVVQLAESLPPNKMARSYT